jgi:hypothetical protein
MGNRRWEIKKTNLGFLSEPEVPPCRFENLSCALKSSWEPLFQALICRAQHVAIGTGFGLSYHYLQELYPVD